MKAMIIGGARGIGKAIDDVVISSGTSDPPPIILDKHSTGSGRYIHATFPVYSDAEKKLHEDLAAATAYDAPSTFTHVFITLGAPSHRKFSDTSSQKEMEILQRNFRAVTSALRFARYWTLATGSYIVISSVSATQADPGGAIYAAAKAGIEGVVRGLAREWVPARVNAIAPGPTMTEQFLQNVPTEDQLKESKRSPHNSLLTPNQVAEAAVGLSRMSGVSGVVLPVDLAGLSSSRRYDA